MHYSIRLTDINAEGATSVYVDLMAQPYVAKNLLAPRHTAGRAGAAEPRLYGMWRCVLGSRYFLARPKSMMYTWFARLPRPIKKLSGLMSRWMKLFECTYSIRDICTAARLVLVSQCIPPEPSMVAAAIQAPTP